MAKQEEKSFLYHTSCDNPDCGSSDGVAVYEGGTGHCFSCEKNYRGLNEENPVEDTAGFEDENINKSKVTQFGTAVRGIQPDIFTQYSYFKDAKGVHVIQHYDETGALVAEKRRFQDKTFSWSGSAKSAVPFGMNLWRSGGKKIYITEGEIDCLSVATAIKGKYPVISINNGAQSAKKDLAKHMDFLNSYDEIILWFDADKPGRKAVAEVAALFEPGKVKTIDSAPFKDANDILKKKGVAGVTKYYYEAKDFTPAGIVNANEEGFEGFMADDKADEVFSTPYNHVEIAKGSITTFVSGSGMGKSTIVREIGHHLLTTLGKTVGHVALEESNAVSRRAYIGIELNKQLVKKRVWAEYKQDNANQKALKDAYDKVIGSNRLYLYNHFGSLDSDSLINKLRFLAVGAGADVIILDHISIVVSGLDDMGDNERRVIDVLMTKLRSLVEETGVAMILVSHLRRPSGDKGHEDGTQVSLSHLRGSASIGQLSDSVIGLEGNQQDEEHKNERIIRRLKDREGGETGIMGKAIYITEEGRLMPMDWDGDIEGDFEDEEKTDY